MQVVSVFICSSPALIWLAFPHAHPLRTEKLQRRFPFSDMKFVMAGD